MNEHLTTKSPPHRKLNRTQVREILERNASLYKSEEGFVEYLVELAVYLLEYEYDWAETGGKIPSTQESISAEPPQFHLIEQRDGKIIQKQISPSARFTKTRICPFCGTEVGQDLICPSCRNLTR